MQTETETPQGPATPVQTQITYIRGDATQPQGEGPKILAHVCNDTGIWGHSFELSLSQRWPEPERSYRAWAAVVVGVRKGKLPLGMVQLVSVQPHLWVMNMIALRAPRRPLDVPPIEYPALEQSLQLTAECALSLGASVHMPYIGSGPMRGCWHLVAPVIERVLCAQGVPVFVYSE